MVSDKTMRRINNYFKRTQETRRVGYYDALNFNKRWLLVAATDNSSYFGCHNYTRFDSLLGRLDEALNYASRVKGFIGRNFNGDGDGLTGKIESARKFLLAERRRVKKEGHHYLASYRTGLRNPPPDEQKAYKAHEHISLQKTYK